ncbi:unnamed protein product [Hapterophycus canaliculatus]
MDKVVAGAENERRGAMLKKFKQVERRSGGLCNPDLLHKVVRSSSTGPTESSPRLSAAAAASEAGRVAALLPPRSELGAATIAATAAATSNLVSEEGGGSGFGGVGGASAASAQDVPWAEDMLCRAIRKRHAAMLRTRGRALAKGLARMLKGVSTELKVVASRLPPWEEDDDDEDNPAPQEEKAALDRIQSMGSGYGSPTHGRTLSQSSYASADTSEEVPDRVSLNSSPVYDTCISGRPPTPSSSAVSAVAAAASAVKSTVVAPVVAVASAVVPGGGGAASSSTTGSADDIKNRRLDWKLDGRSCLSSGRRRRGS